VDQSWGALQYYTGWRVGEMRSLEWRDTDLTGRVIRLRPERAKNKHGLVLPLTGELLAVIERAAARRRLDCVYVFYIDGKPIGDFRKAWHTACVATGLGRWEPTGILTSDGRPEVVHHGLILHDFRRTGARNLVRAGVPDAVAMRLTGHKTRSIFDRYNIVSESDLLAPSERLHRHLDAQPTTQRIVPVFSETRTNNGQFTGARKRGRS